ncbi:septum formation family protein [Saccharopolyspora oryzae]|uniref:Septum formation family protein n=1 Tax=Saccharopolyspora oryzae TaxID=2997343 RepID=A0ABT4VAE8_9PSEU|nr:septum formation family protein [Saccharopolyspora oryzae]MDA3630927.1 septum formation family protein [Saccharopolyspora oryzae]
MPAPDAPPSPSRNKPNTRLVMICAVIGALLVLVVSALLNWPTGTRSAGPDQQGSSPAPKVVFSAPPGSCLSWAEADASDIRQVTCDEPHLFEVTGTADLRPQFDDKAPFPGTEQWQQIKQERCVEVSTGFLSGRFDPNGRFSVGAFTPSEEGWADGDRTLHCGLQQPGPSGKLYPIKGSASTTDQSNIYSEGRCLGINGTAVWDPVDCAKPHAVEITGVVNLGEEFPGGWPAEKDQDPFLFTRCGELTGRFAGDPNAAKDKGLVIYWDTLSEESWNAGSRQVNCKVSAQLPDGSGLAPVTGSIKGDVRVGKEPAPQIAAGQPGAPATEPR